MICILADYYMLYPPWIPTAIAHCPVLWQPFTYGLTWAGINWEKSLGLAYKENRPDKSILDLWSKNVWIVHLSWAKISCHSTFCLETNNAEFHLTEISHSPLHLHILGAFPLYLQKIANLFSVWMTSNKIKLYCTVLGHTRELEFVYYQFLCFFLS